MQEVWQPRASLDLGSSTPREMPKIFGDLGACFIKALSQPYSWRIHGADWLSRVSGIRQGSSLSRHLSINACCKASILTRPLMNSILSSAISPSPGPSRCPCLHTLAPLPARPSCPSPRWCPCRACPVHLWTPCLSGMGCPGCSPRCFSAEKGSERHAHIKEKVQGEETGMDHIPEDRLRCHRRISRQLQCAAKGYHHRGSIQTELHTRVVKMARAG